MNGPAPNCVVGQVFEVELRDKEVAADQVIDGEPRVAERALTQLGDVEVGVWEVTPGIVTDVEVDEVFLVVAGAATIAFADDSPTIGVGPGDVVRLAAGTHTVWTVTSTLRKVYLVTV